MEPFDQGAAARATPASGRIPFPTKPKSESRDLRPAEGEPVHEPIHEPAHEPAHDAGLTAAPTLRNPDEAPVAVDEAEELPLSPFSPAGSAGAEKRPAAFDAGWARAPQMPARKPRTAFFDTMWPAPEPRSTKAPAHAEPNHEAENPFKPYGNFEANTEFKSGPEAKSESRPEIIPEPPVPQPERAAPMSHAEHDSGQAHTAGEVRAVAILKSGVVDGMGYTLYVDGSIEAELPQGTLRFASITELRSHLEKVS
jgi:hypothetical protein